MQGINDQLTVTVDIVKFREIYCSSSVPVMEQCNVLVMTFALFDSIYSMYKYTI